MFAKVAIFTVALAVVSAQYPSHEHGHAYSSQSIVHHQVNHPQQQKQAYQHQGAHHVEYHHAPAAHHAQSYQQANVHHAPAHHQAPAHHEEHHEKYYYAPAKYEYAYQVEDKHTGDIKSAQESRDGDVVKGEYSLHQPDGRIRTVKYTADKHSGFNAEVQYSGKAIEHQAKPQQHYHH